MRTGHDPGLLTGSTDDVGGRLLVALEVAEMTLPGRAWLEFRGMFRGIARAAAATEEAHARVGTNPR